MMNHRWRYICTVCSGRGKGRGWSCPRCQGRGFVKGPDKKRTTSPHALRRKVAKLQHEIQRKLALLRGGR